MNVNDLEKCMKTCISIHFYIYLTDVLKVCWYSEEWYVDWHLLTILIQYMCKNIFVKLMYEHTSVNLIVYFDIQTKYSKNSEYLTIVKPGSSKNQTILKSCFCVAWL